MKSGKKSIFLAFNVGPSSISDYFLELAKNLSQKYKVAIFTNNFNRDIYTLPDIDFYIWPSPRPTKIRDFYFLYKNVRKYKPVMFIALFGSISIFLFAGYLVNVRHRIPWNQTLSTQFKTTAIKELRRKFAYSLATRIFANSTATKVDLIKTFSVPEKKIDVFYNAVKNPFISKECLPYKIVFAGRAHPSKGIEVLLKAMPVVLSKFPDVRLILLGGSLKGPEINKYKKKAAHLNIIDQVTFLGNQSKQRVLEEFSEAYVTIVPSLVEAFGFVIIESFSVKTPVIGSDTSGISEIIRHGEDGFLFEPGNSEDLSEKIITLFSDKKLRDTFSVNCYQRFKNKFELQSAVKELNMHLVDIIEENDNFLHSKSSI